jgi:hypothetical protein
MTHSAGHRGYKASAAAASKDNELYVDYSEEKENQPARNGASTRTGSPRQSTDRKLGNMADEPVDRRNR